MKKSIVIQGSSRSNGNTKKVVDYFIGLSKSEFIDLKNYEISYFDYQHQNETDDFLALIERILEFEIIVFATPVYWYSMSAIMKTFIDRLSDLLKIRKDLGRQLRNKKMMVISNSSDVTDYPEFWGPFVRTAEYLGMEYLGQAHTWIEKDQIPDRVKQELDGLIDRMS